MALSKPMRFDQGFVQQAAAVAEREKRSVPRQIEYWAELGRAVSHLLDAETLIAVREGLARLRVEVIASSPVEPAHVLAQIESMRRSGELAPEFGHVAGVRYQASRTHPGLLEEIGSDGARRVGHFRGGRFLPVDPVVVDEG